MHGGKGVEENTFNRTYNKRIRIVLVMEFILINFFYLSLGTLRFSFVDISVAFDLGFI